MLEPGDREKLKQLVIASEGRARFVYKDARGILTIGIGRNLESVGISQGEMLAMLDNDLDDAISHLNNYSWFSTLNPPRQAALIDLMFNLGWKKFAEFERMIAALELSDYQVAATEMMTSAWAAQVGARALRDVEMLRSGEWPR